MRPVLLALAVLSLATPAADAGPNDPLLPLQWGQEVLRTPDAWPTSTGEGATIAIVDAGIDRAHPDLEHKVVGGATFAGCDRTTGCGDGDWDGENPHGTQVAGIAAARTHNGIGIAGTAPDAKLLAVKVGGPAGADVRDVVAAIRWSTRNGADVINLSLAISIPGSAAFNLIAELDEAVAEARAAGVVVIAASGNGYQPLCDTPAFSDGALCVTAVDREERPGVSSNLPVKPDRLSVAAPSSFFYRNACDEQILTTEPATRGGECTHAPGYGFFGGTSAAAPHVAGVAALLVAQGRDDDEVVRVLTSTARTPGTGLRGTWTPVFGFGIVDAAAAVAAP